MNSKNQKYLVWWRLPSHHQSDFFAALRQAGIDVRVLYFDRVSRSRIEQGWAEISTLPDGEAYAYPRIKSLQTVADWRSRIHIVPGYGHFFLVMLAIFLSVNKVRWIHWSEPSISKFAGYSRARQWITAAVQNLYARLVNCCALGALATGQLATRDFLSWGIPESKISFLPYAVRPPRRTDPDPFISDWIGSRRPVLLYVGLQDYRKGTDVLLESFKLSHLRNSNGCLVIVGKDYSGGEYERLVDGGGLKGNVLLRGVIPAHRIYSAISLCDVLILPSRQDGWGVVLNEAAALGKAMISTDQCSAAFHLIVDGVNGYRVAAGSVTQLAEAMDRYVAAPELATQHGALSREIFGGFTPEANVERFLAAVEKMLSDERHGE